MNTVEPSGAMVAVHSRSPEGLRLLFLHNSEYEVGRDGDWAWGSPSGCREPGEDIAACAARELWEETGIRAIPEPVITEGVPWAVFRLEVSWPTDVRLDPAEHNAFEWISLDEGAVRARPERQAVSFRAAAEAIAAGEGREASESRDQCGSNS